MTLSCRNDPRRDAVRAFQGRVGLDFVEVSADQLTLHVYFLGKLPPELREDGPGLERHLRIEGGARIRDLRILDADPHLSDEPDVDDWLVLRLDRYGDHSRYRLRLLDIAGLDPMYASAEFSFKVGCPSDLDCKTAPACVEAPPPEPVISYLAKDYASFRRLIQDRLALIAPDWPLAHVPDIGVTLTELLAYAGDYLSYFQDAVATEAYLGTARQRISVRRHARLVDYFLHEGCNARAWVAIETDQDVSLPTAAMAFLSGVDPQWALPTVLGPTLMNEHPTLAFERFEPLLPDGTDALRLLAAHNRIGFYDWGREDCCLPRGATRATLRDAWVDGEGEARALDLKPGDVLLLREVRGPRSGLDVDADPARVWPVRLTQVERSEDPLFPVATGGDNVPARPTPLLEVQWHADDALPFPLCLSALGPAPACARLRDLSMAFANVVLVDHGRSLGPLDLGTVPQGESEAECLCEGQPGDVQRVPGRFDWRLPDAPLTHAEAAPPPARAASASLAQDPRAARPALRLVDSGGGAWTAVFDLLASRPDDRHVVAEIDNDGRARLRFGNGELGRRPGAGLEFTARYRIGNGRAGNVGAHSINRIYLGDGEWNGLRLSIDNPLAAAGGSEPESLAQARLLAPGAFRTQLMRAITADDYARIAERDARVQRANAELVWTGSWYEADVALDPYGQVPAGEELIAQTQAALERVRRMGHDLHVETAVYVPLDLALEVCALPGYERGEIHAALLERFGAGRRRDGGLGYFHPDRLGFGQNLRVSALVAEAMAVPGVECARVTRLQRLYAAPNRELEDGVLRLGAHEIPRLDRDPNYPEHGKLAISVGGGR
ncbi:putative baseplate assembly protein [Lysobacter sp. K5869]|uniref:putative baseplate assembly protein n=1 Tax=Lysobacter sp. K5869 TaxID=2820808 RepID=UPI001C063BFB|nr:putative baseplate assembly protein [Lysobacter sp. K5869]QWP78978.1 putative baseplate assembly protein [Lysobacter sp. K5869]